MHLGADDLAVSAARRLAPGLLVGATCRTADDVARAAEDGADYVGFGPVFATTSKAGLPGRALEASARPLDGAARLDQDDGAGAPTLTVPVLAIGGIDATNAAAAVAAGAHGVAVIGAIWRHPDPVAAAKELVRCEAVG